MELLDTAKEILARISTKETIDVIEIEGKCKSLHKKYRETYPWKSISSTLRFLIAHGPAVLRHFRGSVGSLTEESRERKDLRAYK